MVDHELIDIQEDAKTCLMLCSRVLSTISVREIEVSGAPPFSGRGEWIIREAEEHFWGLSRAIFYGEKPSVALWGAIYHQ